MKHSTANYVKELIDELEYKRANSNYRDRQAYTLSDQIAILHQVLGFAEISEKLENDRDFQAEFVAGLGLEKPAEEA